MRRLSSMLLLSAALLFAFTHAVSAQKKPKRALSEKDARRAIAATPPFALNTGAVRVIDISVEGVTPVTVTAEVTTAFRFEKSAGEDGDTASTVEPVWRAVEMRTGDRTWEEFDYFVAPLGIERIEEARATLGSLIKDFETQQRERKSNEAVESGALRIKQLSPLGSSAVAEIGVEAVFTLMRGTDRKWRVTGITLGDVSSGKFAALVSSIDTQKAARARTELVTIGAALEAFRRERGFYVVAVDEAALMDHLSPRYIERIIRIDPWHRPYRYEGTRERFSLRSDGPDGKTDTPDDLSVAGGG